MSSSSDMETRLPEVRGDFTPYWEDGAASSARETGLTRMASERLVQAEALWAILAPEQYPAARLLCGLARRDSLQRTHVGRSLQHHRAGQPVHAQPVEDQAAIRAASRGTIADAAAAGAGSRSAPGRDRDRRRRVEHDVVAAHRSGRLRNRDAVSSAMWSRISTDNVVPSEVTRRGDLAFVAERGARPGCQTFPH